MKLYIYEHCPFCTRARMIFGIKNIEIDVIPLLNDDETTPIDKIGKKMVPILEENNGNCMGESLDIVKYIDNKYAPALIDDKVDPEIQAWIKKFSVYANKLLMPTCIKKGLPEFATQSAIDYFVKKKSAIIGDFAQLAKEHNSFLAVLNNDLISLENIINNTKENFSITDILLFPWLRNSTMLDGVIYPPKVKEYIENMSKLANIPLF